MPTSVPNFSFIAPFVTEIWRGTKIKVGASDIPRRHLADKFLHIAIVPENAYQHIQFQLPSSIRFRDKKGVPKYNVGATSPLPYPETFMCAPSTWQDQTACAQKWFFWGF